MASVEQTIAQARAEALEAAAKAFDEVDVNGNGSIDRQEATAMLAKDGSLGGMTAEQKEAKLDEFFKTLDAD